MKRVLIIVYYWPPVGGSGVQRWVKFVKHLRSFGWEPVIYTPLNPYVHETDDTLLKEIPEGVEIIRGPVFEISRYFGAQGGASAGTAPSKPSVFSKVKQYVGNYVRGNFFIPDPRILWVRPSVKLLSEYLQQKPVDVIVSSTPPHSLHLIAQKLSAKFNIPWLADFRDPWLEVLRFHNFNTSEAGYNKHKQLFNRVINTADAVVVAHESVRQNFATQTTKPVTLITNGYDNDDIINSKPAQLNTDKFNLVFVGIFYNILNSTAFWKALSNLVKTNKAFADKLQITFVGKQHSDITNDINAFGLLPYCDFKGYLTHTEAVGYEKAADALLLFTPADKEFKYVIPGKLFEYLAVKKPILCIAAAENDSAQITANTNAGYVIPPDNETEIATVLESVFDLFTKGKLQVTSSGYEKYERKNQTAQLVAELNRIAK